MHPSASPQVELDSKQFAKLCRDAGLLRKGATTASADLCFAKARREHSPAGARRVTFAGFLAALALLAREKGVSEGEVLATVAACPGPRLNGSTPEYTRLADKGAYVRSEAPPAPKLRLGPAAPGREAAR